MPQSPHSRPARTLPDKPRAGATRLGKLRPRRSRKWRCRPANDNGGLRRRLRQAVPPPGEAIAGAFVWGAAMAVSAQTALWLSMAGITSHFWKLSLLCFAGGAIAWPVALMAIRFIARNRPREIAFAATMISLSVMTVAVTATIFAIIYRTFYAQWHGEFATWLWFVQLAFTSASAFYQFAVMGLRLYLPLGALFLLFASLLMARRFGPGKPPNKGFSTT